MKTRALTHDEFMERVVPAYRGVFRGVDPFGEPFQDTTPDRLILYPVPYHLDRDQLDAVAGAAHAVGDDGFYVVETESRWRELVEDPPELGTPRVGRHELDAGLPPELVRKVWAAANRWDGVSDYDQGPAWYFSLDDLAPWHEISGFGTTGEVALVSASSTWGVIISHEDHAVVGGPPAFVETVLDRWPPAVTHERGADGEWQASAAVPPADQALSFLNDMKSWSNPVNWLASHLRHIYGEQRARELFRAFMD